jgi:hypothetical protein
MTGAIRILVVSAIVLVGTGRAHAYPQFELSKDQSCAGCHISPTGGGLLSENGMTIAESISAFGTAPEFMYGKVKTPDWLALGGDFRGAYGYLQAPQRYLVGFPMQGDLYGVATKSNFSLHVTAGLRPVEFGNENATHVWSREHYVMWRQDPSSPYGMYVRAGRLMPVFGLRLAEHAIYTERYGGLPLYGEAYGAALEYVAASFEVHATGFVHDSIASAVEHGDGGAIYVEQRLGAHAAIGAEGKYSSSSEQTSTYGGVTGKLYVERADLLLQAEAELIHNKLMATSANQLAGYLLASRPLAEGWLLDVGVGHFTQDTAVAGLYRDCLDANLHWFATPHIELLATARLELLDGGSGPTGGYALAQLHYRL